MTAERNNHDKPSACARERKRNIMLEKALSQPGVRAVMEVYGEWHRQNQGLDPHRVVSAEPSRMVATNCTNTR